MAQNFALVGSSVLLGVRIRIARPAEWAASIDLTDVDGCTAQVWLPLAAAPVTWTFAINATLTTPSLLVVEHAYHAGALANPGQAQGRAPLMIYPTISGVAIPESGPYVLPIRQIPAAYPGA